VSLSVRQIGTLRFEIVGPTGFEVLPDDDPLAGPFLEARPEVELSWPVKLELATAIPAGPPEIVTGGWALARTDGGSWQFSLPDQAGSFFWKATLEPESTVVHLGPSLVEIASQRLRQPFRYPLDQIVTIHTLASRQGLLLHGAGWAHDGRALIAAGVSGAGKTTISRLLRAVAPELIGLSDDRVLVGRGGGGWRAWGTPWAGEGKIADPAGAGLSAIVFLEHGDHERLHTLAPHVALERLLPVVSIPWYDPGLSQAVLTTLEALVAAIPAQVLKFRPIPAAAVLLRKLLAVRCPTD
jgi:hypothetical protein